MAKPWKPGFDDPKLVAQNKRRFYNEKPVETWKTYPTYRELKKHLKEHILNSPDGQLHVFRHRRGDWGQWYEIWELRHGKPVIVDQGWD